MHESAEFYFRRSFERYSAGDFAGGDADLDQAILLAPDKLEYRRTRGQFRYQAQQYQLAIEDYSKIVELSTDKVVLEEAYHVLAITHEALGLTDELLADLDWLITHKLASGGIYAWRGLYKTRRGQNEEALEDLTMALQLSPGTDNYLLQRANVYEQLERYDEEISDVNAVLDHTRTNDMFKRTLYLKRATAFFKLGNKAQAYADFAVAVQLGATSFVTNAAEYFRAMKT